MFKKISVLLFVAALMLAACAAPHVFIAQLG